MSTSDQVMYLFGVSVPMVCLLWHCVCSILTIVGYVVGERLQREGIYGRMLRDAYLAFAVIGMSAYAVGGGPLFVYAYKYGHSGRQRWTRFLGGVAVVFWSWSFPVFIIHLVMMCTWIDYNNPIDSIIFALSLMSAAVGGCIVWFAYMHLLAQCIHQYRGVERQIDMSEGFGPYPMQPVHMSPNVCHPDTI